MVIVEPGGCWGVQGVGRLMLVAPGGRRRAEKVLAIAAPEHSRRADVLEQQQV